jgi:hypothetical protein
MDVNEFMAEAASYLLPGPYNENECFNFGDILSL